MATSGEPSTKSRSDNSESRSASLNGIVICFEKFRNFRNFDQNYQWQSFGKPSTKFPHEGLVECLHSPHISSSFLLNFLEFHIFMKIEMFSLFFSVR